MAALKGEVNVLDAFKQAEAAVARGDYASAAKTFSMIAKELRDPKWCDAIRGVGATAEKLASACRRGALPPHAGIVAQRKARSTGTLVGLYRSSEAGIETDPDLPWSTVCEAHGSVVCSATRKLADAAMSCPDDWCDDCRTATHAKGA